MLFRGFLLSVCAFFCCQGAFASFNVESILQNTNAVKKNMTERQIASEITGYNQGYNNYTPRNRRVRRRNRRGSSIGTIQAVQQCQRKFRRNLRRWVMCGCRSISNKRNRWSCQRAIARSETPELCAKRRGNSAFQRLFGRKCRRISHRSPFGF